MIRYFKVDIREPYMGNMIVIGIRVDIDFTRSALVMTSIQTMRGTVAQEVRVLTEAEWNELFND